MALACVPHRLVDVCTARFPVNWPGMEAWNASSDPVLIGGGASMYRKASTGLPLASEAARKVLDCLGKPKPLASKPMVSPESSQAPRVRRTPEKAPAPKLPPKRG